MVRAITIHADPAVGHTRFEWQAVVERGGVRSSVRVHVVKEINPAAHGRSQVESSSCLAKVVPRAAVEGLLPVKQEKEALLICLIKVGLDQIQPVSVPLYASAWDESVPGRAYYLLNNLLEPRDEDLSEDFVHHVKQRDWPVVADVAWVLLLIQEHDLAEKHAWRQNPVSLHLVAILCQVVSHMA